MATAVSPSRSAAAAAGDPTPIEQLLESLRGAPFAYIPNPGNAGDSIIASATFQLFDRMCLAYTTPDAARLDGTGKVIVYGGGGNLVGMTTFSARVLARLHRGARRLIVLPQTVKAVDPLLREFGANVEIVCREQRSYDYVSATATAATARLMDDMALSLDPKALLANPPRHVARGALLAYLRLKLGGADSAASLASTLKLLRAGAIARQQRHLLGRPEVYCFRRDGEKTEIAIPADNIDASEVFAYGAETRPVAFFSASQMLGFLANFQTVHTNRLHVAIGSALLGLDVRFHANNYYKCREVYLFSLQHRFPNVKWMS